ncbi:unnamed protein product [Arabis nemorensis]|uniref:Ion transport domain-containing protein n=1 Tax=Arabis nemorensis TaxID=586526 RepID=A0A565B924_9BRAS|nr:unnamed protein product [Arabis nemorensis]
MSGPLCSARRPDQSFFPPPPNRAPDSSFTVDVPSEDVVVSRNTNLLRSGQLGIVSASRFPTALYDDARGWAKGFASFVRRCEEKCIEVDLPMTKALVSLRSIWDLIFSINILLQFRLAYVAPESRIVGAGQLVDQPGKIARNYIRGKFCLDLFIVLPIPQLVILWLLRSELGLPIPESDKHIIRAILLFQYIPKLYRLLPLLATGFIFESAWANFVINLLTFMLAGHTDFREFKNAWNNSLEEPINIVDCVGGIYELESLRPLWRESASVNACFQENGFTYGIYLKAVNLTTQSSFFTRYSYSLFWGFQQISTLAGNLSPSYSEWEVYFTMGIIGLGLLLFARLIGNMHNFLQALDRRRMEMMLRRRDAEQWMSHRLLPENIRKRVREAERFNWAATRGANEELLFENMPEDLQRDIKRHLFKFLKKVRIFSLMDESILDSIRERLKQRTYIRKGDVCGEELLTWCLDPRTLFNKPRWDEEKDAAKGTG